MPNDAAACTSAMLVGVHLFMLVLQWWGRAVFLHTSRAWAKGGRIGNSGGPGNAHEEYGRASYDAECVYAAASH
jgi:hypothetical protein